MASSAVPDPTLSQLQFSVIQQIDFLTRVGAEVHRPSTQRSAHMTQLRRDQSQLWALFLAASIANGATAMIEAQTGQSVARSRIEFALAKEAAQ